MPRPLVFGALVFGELKLCLFQGTGVQKPRTSFFFLLLFRKAPCFRTSASWLTSRLHCCCQCSRALSHLENAVSTHYVRRVIQYAVLNRRCLDPRQSCTVIDGKNPDKIKTFSYYAECPYEGHCQPGTGFLIPGSGGKQRHWHRGTIEVLWHLRHADSTRRDN